MDRGELEDEMLWRDEQVAGAIGVVAGCLVNAINAQASIDNVRFTKDLIAGLARHAGEPTIGGIAAEKLRDALQVALNEALAKAGIKG